MTRMPLADAIAHPNYLYVRAFKLGGTAMPSGRSGVYHRDPTSPTGRRLVSEGPSDEANRILDERNLAAALSPTEGLGS